jgi:hypothetical protein
MIHVGLDDQRRDLGARIRLKQRSDCAFAEFDSVPALRRKPAAFEAFRCDHELVTFAGREIEVFLNASFGKATDDAGRHKNNQGKRN